ncbi:MAG TPA: hypothetical protein VGD48_08330 [Kutzneria sp.]
MDTPRLNVGTGVVYFDPEPSVADFFCRATATGPEIIDPRTHDWWAPVRLSDGAVDLLPSILIVRVDDGNTAV